MGQKRVICAAYQISAFHESQMTCRGISLKGCRKLELSSANEAGREVKAEQKGEQDQSSAPATHEGVPGNCHVRATGLQG